MGNDNKNLDIEVLRAFAIIFTVYHHRVWLLPGDKGEYYEKYFTFFGGVDLFLVISGFVIGMGLLRNWNAAKDLWGFVAYMVAFWIRRAWRIWPVAFVWMLIPLICCVIFKDDLWAGLGDNLTAAAAIMTGTQNVHAFLGEQGIVPRGTMVYGPYWSLSLEEQFYLVLPILLFGLVAKGRKYLVPILLFLVLAQFFLPRPVWSLAWVLRSDALLLGVLIAYACDYKSLRDLCCPSFLNGRLAKYIFTLGLLALNAVLYSGKVVPFFVGMVAVLSAMLVWAASYNRGYIFPDGVVKRILVYLGGRSYSIYLCHMTVFYLTKEFWMGLAAPGEILGGRYTLRYVVTALFFILVLSELSYRFVEVPLKNKGRGLARDFLAKHSKC